MSARVGPRYSTWSTLTLVTTATCAVDDVRRVPGAAEPDLDDGDVDRDVGEPAERGGGQDLEVARRRRAGAARRSAMRLEQRRRASSSAIGSPFQVIRSLTRSRCGLVYAPTESPTRDEERGRHPHDRRLAVRAGDVDRPGTSSCGRAEQRDERLDALERRRASRARGTPAGTPSDSRLTCASSQRAAPRRSCHRRSLALGPCGRSAELAPRPRTRPTALELEVARRGPPRARRRARPRARRGARACRARPRARTSVRSDRLLRRLRLAHRAQHVGRDRVDDVGIAVAGRIAQRRRRRATAARCTEPVLPPRPHLFGHERQERREEPQQRGRARRRARAAPRPRPRRRRRRTRAASRARRSRRRSPRRTARCARAPGRSRSSSNATVASSTTSAERRRAAHGRAASVTVAASVGDAPRPRTPSTNFDAFRSLIASRRPTFIWPSSNAVSTPGRPLSGPVAHRVGAVLLEQRASA